MRLRIAPRCRCALLTALFAACLSADAQGPVASEAIPPPYAAPPAPRPLNPGYASLLEEIAAAKAGPAEVIAPAEPAIETIAPAPEDASPVPNAAPPAAEETAPTADPAEVVEAIEAAAAGEAPPPAADPAPAEEVPLGELADTPDEASWWAPYAWLRRSRLDSGFEFGLNGASGTSESLSFRTGGYLKRETDDYKLNTSLYYNKTSADGVEVQSNALLDSRYDFLLGDSPWSLFVLSQTFYDEFQAFDLNVNANAGVGYQWIDDESVQLITSFGSGASREFGDIVADEWVPEASLGINFEQRLGDSHRFYAKADYFPQWEDLSVYRVVADMGLEIDLPPPSGMALKLSATDRFDSNPSGAEPHNFNYAVSLLWKL